MNSTMPLNIFAKQKKKQNQTKPNKQSELLNTTTT